MRSPDDNSVAKPFRGDAPFHKDTFSYLGYEINTI